MVGFLEKVLWQGPEGEMGGDGTGSKAVWCGGKGTFHNTRTRDDRHNHEGRLKITAKSESSKLGIHGSLSHSQLKRKIHRSKVQRCTCHALLWQEHLQVDAWELTPAAGKPAGHTSGSTTLPSAGCMDNGPTTALLAGTAKHQESLLLSACFRGRQSCTTLLLPRAVWGTSTWGQPDAGMPSQGRIPGPCSNLCLSLSSLPLLEGGGQ